MSTIRKSFSPEMAVPRLRALYFVSLALCAVLLSLLRIAIDGEQRLAHALTLKTRAAVAVPHIIVLRVPPVRAAVQSNIHRARDAVLKETSHGRR